MKSDFRIQVERLRETPEAHHFEASASWWAERETDTSDALCEVETPFCFDLEARRQGDTVLIEGKFEGQVALECSRCAKRYSHALRDPFRLVLEPAGGSAPADPEGERALAERGLCLGEDLEAGSFRGPVISLDDFFGEVIALAMPIQPLCDENCPGICPHCGVDLSETQCDCVDAKVESPFAVLSALKNKD